VCVVHQVPRDIFLANFFNSSRSQFGIPLNSYVYVHRLLNQTCTLLFFQLQSTHKIPAITCKHFKVEQKEPAFSLLVPYSAAPILSPESAADNAENVSASTLPSLSPTPLPLSDAAIHCDHQPENQQLQNGTK
jgi:hypothetical protein